MMMIKNQQRKKATTQTTPNQAAPTTNRVGTRHILSPNRKNVVESPLGFDWHNEPSLCLQEVNGSVHYREWGVRTRLGDILRRGCNADERFSRLDIFYLMFPPQELALMLFSTNEQLTRNRGVPTTVGELLKFLGIVILSTKYEFTTRASLWSKTAATKYELPPNFGRLGMNRKRFDEIWKNIRFAYQPTEKHPDMSSERQRWLLVDGFVKNFNDHRKETFIPSDLICVDESISRWYGQGGDWINHGLPMYVAIDRKPENGCEIQNSACGRSGVMLQLNIVKTAKEQAAIDQEEGVNNNILHGTKILKQLVSPWAFSDRLVCADSYFASVVAVEELRTMKLRFIGVVKTATRRYPMQYLASRRLHARGDRMGVVHKDMETGIPDMLAFVWMDRERRYFVASAGSLTAGDPYCRSRWRQVNKSPNAEPEKVTLQIPIPRAAELYYSCCGKIDQHNRDRQDTLGIERKLKTHDWSLRVNLTIFGMIVVDTWKVYSQLSFGEEDDNQRESQKNFYGNLAAELIDNNYDRVGGARAKRRSDSSDDEIIDSFPKSGVDAHLTPTKIRRNDKNDRGTHSFQGRCRVCKLKTTYQCSVCRDDPNIKDQGWLCHTKNGKTCFPEHLAAHHS
jgi:Transposase IS4